MAGSEYKASVRYAGDELFIGTSPSGNTVAIDVKGDRKSAPSPLEMLLISVAACTAADVASIMEKKRQDVREYVVEVTGTRVDDYPRKFVAFHVHHIVRGHNISEQSLVQAIELSDTKYCSVAATVRPTATITTSHEIIEVEV
jgi:putative redox protein